MGQDDLLEKEMATTPVFLPEEFHMNCRIIFASSLENVIGIFIGIALIGHCLG